MNLRKITARAIAVASCAALLSTNALAASITITPTEESGKLKVALGGDAAGQVTFLAVDNGIDLASVAGGNIQYIEQDAKTADGALTYTFGKRTGGANKVDLYSGGENVTSYASKLGVAVVATATINTAATTIDYTATAENDFATKSATDVKTFLEGKLKVDYTAIGATEPTTVTLGTANGSDFVLGAQTTTDNENYTIAVTYKGISAGNVTVKETDPKKATSIGVTGGTGKTFYYDSAESEFTAAEAKALLKDDITVTATYDDETTGTISADNLTFEVSGGTVTVKYGTLTAPTTISVTLVKKAISSAETVGSTATVEITARASDTVDAAFVENKVKAAVTGNFVKYTWNDGGTSYDALSDLTLSVSNDASDSSGNTFSVNVTSAKKSGWSANFKAHVTVSNSFGIKGKVTVADTWGIDGTDATFNNGIPVGAVVTAIPVTTANNSLSGNVTNTALGYTAKAAMVDASGNYELELEPGTYNVYVSHTRYAVKRINSSRTTVDVYRTVLDGTAKQEIEISESDVDLHTHDVTLRYAYAGDMTLDGSLNNTDYSKFKANFGLTVPAVSE